MTVDDVNIKRIFTFKTLTDRLDALFILKVDPMACVNIVCDETNRGYGCGLGHEKFGGKQ